MNDGPRILFLDIDGVINSARFFAAQRGRGLTILDQWADMLDPAAIVHLNRIVDATGCQVVLSSSWRCGVPLSRVEEALRARGFTGHLRDKTPDLGHRGREVRAWFEPFGIPRGRVVALDDCTLGAGMDDRLVRTTYAEGLTAAHADRAIAMLGGPRES